MSIERIEALAQVFARSRLSSMQFEGPGTSLVLKQEMAARSVGETPGESAAPISPRGTAVQGTAVKRIKARATGTLILNRFGSFPLPGVGDTVSRGDIVGFVRVGDAVSAVVAGEQGTIGRTVSTDGELVGYDSVLHELN